MLRMIAGFLLGAAAVAVATTDRGRRLASDTVDGLEAAARRELENVSGRSRKKKEPKNDAV